MVHPQKLLWLNNNFANMNNAPPENICEMLYQFSNLIVYVAPIRYVLGMKLESGREQDLKDIGLIIQHEDFKDPFELFDQLQQQGFSRIDFSMLLEGFSYAYGMDWLEKFYKEHEKQLETLFEDDRSIHTKNPPPCGGGFVMQRMLQIVPCVD